MVLPVNGTKDAPGKAELPRFKGVMLHPDRPDHSHERTMPGGWSAFVEHMRHGHGIKNLPKDEAEAWLLHQQLHSQSGESPWRRRNTSK
jgi:hypothetical protein